VCSLAGSDSSLPVHWSSRPLDRQGMRRHPGTTKGPWPSRSVWWLRYGISESPCGTFPAGEPGGCRAGRRVSGLALPASISCLQEWGVLDTQVTTAAWKALPPARIGDSTGQDPAQAIGCVESTRKQPGAGTYTVGNG